MTKIIYKQDLKIETLYNLYNDAMTRNTINDENKTVLTIYMKKINNVRKSIKLRICELIRENKLQDDFFEEDRTFILNNLNTEHPHFIFTENGLKSLASLNDDKMNCYVNDYLIYLDNINQLC